MKKHIRKCIEIEKLTAKTYQEFAKSSQNDTTLQGIWLDMAEDEEEHVLQLDFAARMPIDAAFSGIASTSPNPDEMYEVVNRVYQQAKLGRQGKMEMLADAVRLENQLRGVHATHALIFKDTSLLKTFECLAASEEKHVAGLENYLRKFKQENQIT